MKNKKTHHLYVKAGEYMKDGEKKNRNVFVGAVIEGQYGPFIVLERWFNPAGVVVKDEHGDIRDTVLVNMSPVKDSTTHSHVDTIEDMEPPF